MVKVGLLQSPLIRTRIPDDLQPAARVAAVVVIILRSFSPGFFVFLMIIRAKKKAGDGLFLVYVGNTPYGKYHTSRTDLRSDCSLSQKKAYIHANLFVLLPDRFDAFFNPKNVSETNAINITPSVGQLEKRTTARATDAV